MTGADPISQRPEATAGVAEQFDDSVMTATRLRELIAEGLGENPDVARCANTGTILMDRIALNVFDHNGYVWRVHVLKEPFQAGERR